MRVKPAPGMKVRDPVTKRQLPDEGAEVRESAYWVRRVAAGDVVVVQHDQIPDSLLMVEET